MPLVFKSQLTLDRHLLGKKSWNVYNADNIARVRRDEAAAKAAEEAEEQRMQEIDSQHRLAILRGEVPPPLENGVTNGLEVSPKSSREGGPDRYRDMRRKRKRHGEDDTDFELRVAKERTDAVIQSLESSRQPKSSAPIVDRHGHIDLFGDEKTRAHSEKNQEAEQEAHKKRREYEDQYTMRFSNATGRHGTNNPWYSQAVAASRDAPLKDVWGNDDPRRRERDTNRMAASDPLAMMKKGASRVRELKQERRKFQEEREDEMRQMRKDEQRREKHRQREEREHRRRSASPKSKRRRHRSSDAQDDKYDRDWERGRRRDRDREQPHRRNSLSHERESRCRHHD
ncbi:homocitrate synthase [Metarhizium album ARSEF 1941]|uniref:Homocitrate synthase n=1 Tax=Metarhizium album (strain ARSEF 1941) TaxID=1081103 RepID=A0A0B2X8H9_METAS|nr:homocitrate synthase [Metarhizium album ARSEF 1941]KHO01825.1 homocitrate synthase [Metarhizium album ARSEF 1941]